jgi:hypothetical protein
MVTERGFSRHHYAGAAITTPAPQTLAMDTFPIARSNGPAVQNHWQEALLAHATGRGDAESSPPRRTKIWC